jgi:hypothetical protein
VSEFRIQLENEIRFRVKVPPFRIPSTLETSDPYQTILKREIEKTDVFLALTSPAWFTSTCHNFEFEAFCKQELRARRTPRVVGITWVRCLPEMGQQNRVARRPATLRASDCIREIWPLNSLHRRTLVFVPKRRKLGKALYLTLDHVAFAGKELRDCTPESRIGDPVSAVSRRREIAALDLMRPLGARLDALQSVCNCEFDCLIIAAFEMEELVVSIAPPIAAVDRIFAEKVKRARDVIGAAARHHEDDLLGHSLADQREEAAIEVS